MNTAKKSLEIIGNPVYPLCVGKSAYITESDGVRVTSRVLAIDSRTQTEIAFETLNTHYLLHLQEMGNDFVHKSFSLMFAADSQTAERISKAAAGGDDMAIFIVHAAGVIQVAVAADSLRSEKCVNLPVGPAVRTINFRNRIIGHTSGSS